MNRDYWESMRDRPMIEDVFERHDTREIDPFVYDDITEEDLTDDSYEENWYGDNE